MALTPQENMSANVRRSSLQTQFACALGPVCNRRCTIGGRTEFDTPRRDASDSHTAAKDIKGVRAGEAGDGMCRVRKGV